MDDVPKKIGQDDVQIEHAITASGVWVTIATVVDSFQMTGAQWNNLKSQIINDYKAEVSAPVPRNLIRASQGYIAPENKNEQVPPTQKVSLTIWPNTNDDGEPMVEIRVGHDSIFLNEKDARWLLEVLRKNLPRRVVDFVNHPPVYRGGFQSDYDRDQ